MNDTTVAPATERRVRTRFAPSPTGSPHVGNIRTALFSWLFARHFGGDFLLRIEDTDQGRLVKGSLQDIIASLSAIGMDYDEGPDAASVAALDAEKYGTVRADLLPEHGGDYGSYFQSQRLHLYREAAERLVAEGKAYYAFDTPEELEARKAAVVAQGRTWLYDRRDRGLPLDEARARVAAGEKHVIRFKMPTEGLIRVEDALRGVLDFDATTQDDFIALKSDGFPTYHLAVAVDDHHMGVTHVIRGEDWLPSAPKHQCLFDALGWEAPVFVHVANVLGPDGKKYSKRHGAVSVFEFLDQGILPEALFNFLALVGWSPGDDTEIMDRDEVVRRFGLEGLSVSPAIFDPAKLTWMNGVYIRNMAPDELAQRVLPILAGAGLIATEPDETRREYAKQVILLEQERLKRLDEAPALTDFFFVDLPEYATKSVDKWLRRTPGPTAAYLHDLHDSLAQQPAWTVEALEATTRAAGARHGRERGELTHPVRVAVTGREVGPGLFETMAVLGRERVLRRLEHARGLTGG